MTDIDLSRGHSGTCPLCEEELTPDQHIGWRMIDGLPIAVHATCLDPTFVDPKLESVT